MITYQLLDSTHILRSCLHHGPVLLTLLDPLNSSNPEVESHAKGPSGTVDAFLKALAKTYGAYGYAAIDDDKVIGQVRFYPSVLADTYKTSENEASSNTCILEQHQVNVMGSLGSRDLPPKSVLSPRALSILCFQLVNDYKAMAEGRSSSQPSYLHRGIATILLENTIEWARSEGWEEIHAKAIPHIPPLMTWSCHLSVKRYERLGFDVTPSPETWDGPISQRRGFHGEAMKQMWEPYKHLSDEDVSQLNKAVLKL